MCLVVFDGVSWVVPNHTFFVKIKEGQSAITNIFRKALNQQIS